MRALLFVYSTTSVAVDADPENAAALKRFQPGGLYANPETMVAASPGEPGQAGELAPGIYAIKWESGDVQFRALNSAQEGVDFDILRSASLAGKDEFPQIMAMSVKFKRIRDFAAAQGVSSDKQLTDYFGELSAPT
jgi:hypothetical protein